VLIRWLRTPKGLTLIVLLVLLAIETPLHGPGAVAIVILMGLVGAAVDLGLIRYLTGAAEVPDGGAITGVLVALVIDPAAPVVVPLAGTVAGLVVKHTLRTRWSNILNPAGAGLLIACLLPGGSRESWWGGLGDAPVLFLAVLLALGSLIADRENKLPAVLSFAAVYVALLTLVAIRQPNEVASAFRIPDVNAAIFFALFMLTDPPTSPTRYEHQVIFGSIVGGFAAVGLLVGIGVAHLPTALVAGNVWESWRRPRAARTPNAVTQ
jgi:Na+-translocating ferredoxin:NAD+ oxidoreductase RnfD subunit